MPRDASVDVLHLIWSGSIGGIERTVEALVTHAPRHHALLLDGTGPIGDALVGAGRAERLGMRAGWDLGKLPRLAGALRALSPRVVHAQSHALLPLLVARLALPYATWVYQEQSPRALKHDAKFRLLYAFLRAARARLVAPTAAVADAMKAYLPAATEIAVVPNPCAVPLAGDAPRPLRHPPVVGVVARLEPQKRVDLLLEAIAELHRRGAACRGLVVGGGSLEDALRRRRAELGLERWVDFAGPQLEVSAWLDRIDVFLSTSASEPYGVASIEAMARRVPVVAMPCPGGLVELAQRGGLLLADRSVETAAAAVEHLLADPTAREELRRRGAPVASESTPEAVLRQLQSVYC